jgi:hypothetical protein
VPKKTFLALLVLSLGAAAALLVGAIFWPSVPPNPARQAPPAARAPVPTYQRQQLTKFKGLWPHPGELNALLAAGEEIKRLGINIVPVTVPYCVRGKNIKPIVYGPPLPGKLREKFIIRQIERAHQQGFAVFLELNTLAPRCETEIQHKAYFIQKFVAESRRWAAIAERYQVELFSPLNESSWVLAGGEFAWAQKVLPEVKKVFRGEVVLKMAGMGRKIGNYRGYD